MHRPSPVRRLIVLAALLLPTVAPAAARAGVDLPDARALADTVHLHVVPQPAIAEAGDTVLVELSVPFAGPAFNAYDAYLTYDPAVLRFLPEANLATQEGPLMTTGCGLRFHVFQADTLAGRLRISHSLLCAGQSRTGPGVVYRVRFRCRDVDALTPLDLLIDAPWKTAFYNAGLFVTPLATVGATVRVGTPWVAPAPQPVPAAATMRLAAAPNPFNPLTTISLAGAGAGPVEVTVYGPDGRRVRALWRGTVADGSWSGTWDGRDDGGRAVAAGLYLVQARGPGRAAVARVALVR